jgi:cyclophilin family peptidyl-prolyl cis-trans isomerase
MNMKKMLLVVFCLTSILIAGTAQNDSTVTDKDRKQDVLLQTSMGNIVIRLSDSTPLHRDNFLKLVKIKYYDGILFHRVIKDFMIQGGDPDSKTATSGTPLGMGSPGYTVPAEFKPSLFHKKGVIAAARMPDHVNPQKASSGSQFYLAQWKIYTDAGLDSMETYRMGGKKIAPERRAAYKTVGGIPFLDDNYTVYGEIIEGIEVVEKIAAVAVSMSADLHRPFQDVKIIEAKLIKRKKK